MIYRLDIPLLPNDKFLYSLVVIQCVYKIVLKSVLELAPFPFSCQAKRLPRTH